MLPRVEPVVAAAAGGAAGGGADPDGGGRAALRGRMDGSAAELDLDGLRPYREGTPAIAHPLAGGGAQRRDARAPAHRRRATRRPLVVLDATAAAVGGGAGHGGAGRRRRCACTWRGGAAARCCCRATAGRSSLAPDLAAWPAAHARLALVEGRHARPPLARARRAGAVIWVSARADAPRDLARAAVGGGWLVTPSAGSGRRGLHGRRLRRPAPGPGRARDPGPEGGVSAAATGIPWACHARPHARRRPGGRPCGWRPSLALAAFVCGHWAQGWSNPAGHRHRPRWWSSPRRSARRWWRSAAPACRARWCTSLHWPRWRPSARRPWPGAAGCPSRLLLPGAWDELATELDRGLSGIRTVEWPYAGDEEWVRLVILLGAPAAAGAGGGAGVLAGAPRARAAAARWRSWRCWPLYGVPVTEHDPGAPLVRGLVLFLLVAAWLWLPRVSVRDAAPAAIMVVAVGVLALPLGRPARRRDGGHRLPVVELVRRQGRHLRLEPQLRAA